MDSNLQHYGDINHDHNFKCLTFCLIETNNKPCKIVVQKFINSSKYSYISIHDDHGLMMRYDTHMHLDSFNTTTNDGLKYVTLTYAQMIHKAILVTRCKRHFMA